MENNLTFIFLIDNIAGDQLIFRFNQNCICDKFRMKAVKPAA